MTKGDLSEQITSGFGLTSPITCRLLRSYTNDVYRIEAAGGHFALKVYGRSWRMEEELRYEISLLRHLSAQGVPVASPVAAVAGDFLLPLETPAGRRYAVLFEFAAGEKPLPPFTLELYSAFGRSIARMHEAADGFTSPYPRQPLNLESLIDEPLDLILPLLEEPSDRAFLKSAGDHVRCRVTELAAHGLDWGPIHGDATFDNLHVTKDGEMILYDFDSGGPGWRAADLQGWAADNVAWKEKGESFLEGYASTRSLCPADMEAAPHLTLAWDFRGMKVDLEQRVLREGPDHVRDYLSRRLVEIRSRRSLSDSVVGSG